MKRTTLTALAMTLVFGMGVAATAQAQVFEQRSWSNAEEFSSNQSWSSGFGGTTYQGDQRFRRVHEQSGMRATRDGVWMQNTSGREWAYRQDGFQSRPGFGGVENRGFVNEGSFSQINSRELNMSRMGNRMSNFDSAQGFNSRSGFQEFQGPGGFNRNQFQDGHRFNSGNAWVIDW
jgi:hypothetical protein